MNPDKKTGSKRSNAIKRNLTTTTEAVGSCWTSKDLARKAVAQSLRLREWSNTRMEKYFGNVSYNRRTVVSNYDK